MGIGGVLTIGEYDREVIVPTSLRCVNTFVGLKKLLRRIETTTNSRQAKVLGSFNHSLQKN